MLDADTDQGRSRAAHLGPDRRRPQVLDAALEIALTEGLGGVTFGAVAARLGVTRPVVYTCFADRVELIDTLLTRETERLVTSTLNALHSAFGPDPEVALVTGYRSLLHMVCERPESWRLVFAATPDPAVAARFVEARATVAKSASRWIHPALVAWWGTADVDRKLPVLVALFMASCEAAVRAVLDPSSGWSADELGELYGRVMCAAFRAA